MGLYDELTERQREQLAAPFRDRARATQHPDWRRYWESWLELVNGNPSAAFAGFEHLTTVEDAEVRVAAFQALGEMHRDRGDEAAALSMYESAVRIIDVPYARYLVAETQLRRGNRVEAERLLQSAILATRSESDHYWLQTAVRDYLSLCTDGDQASAVIEHLRGFLSPQILDSITRPDSGVHSRCALGPESSN